MFKKKYILALLLLTAIFLFNLNIRASNDLHVSPGGKVLLNYNKDISELLDKKQIDQDKISILVEKSKYKLTLYYDMQAIKSYPIVMGSNPVDDKIKDGDGCTPEGSFKIKAHYNHPKWSKFLWLNYPTGQSWQKYTAAKSQGKLKFSDSIGSQVGIHGVPENDNSLIDKKVNWTTGNISLKNSDINEIYEIVKDGISVEITH